jgi:hypothetical protein
VTFSGLEPLFSGTSVLVALPLQNYFEFLQYRAPEIPLRERLTDYRLLQYHYFTMISGL